MPDDLIAGRPVPLPEDYAVGLISEGHELYPRAEALEYQVFLASGYVEPNEAMRVLEYDEWAGVSQFLAVVDDQGHPVGVVRVLIGNYATLPLAKLERTDSSIDDPVCEYASLAVDPAKRSTGVAEELYRAVWRHAESEGATALVALVDPWLHDLLREYYGFPFESLGPSKYYMGGDVRPIGMTVAIPYEVLPESRPQLWEWLLEGKPAKEFL